MLSEFPPSMSEPGNQICVIILFAHCSASFVSTIRTNHYEFMTVATTLAESFSLWAIRIAMILMVVVFVAELRGAKSTNRVVAMIWLLGAMRSVSVA